MKYLSNYIANSQIAHTLTHKAFLGLNLTSLSPLKTLCMFQEWLWPIGFFLRARLNFAEMQGGAGCLARTIAQTHTLLSRHYSHLQSSAWRGLPELTNTNGSFCPGSCPTQAWSMGCVLEVREPNKDKFVKNI